MAKMAGGIAISKSKWLQSKLFAACFAAGTKLLTPEGYKNIEEFNVGDLVLSRDETNPNGPVEPRRVEETFVRLGKVLHLHVGGQVVKTTAEHPFWVQGKEEWVPAGEVQTSDVLVSHDGKCLGVEEVYDTGEIETVYNMRVAEYHTYFVGCDEWGFSVWAHNTYSGPQMQAEVAGMLQKLGYNPKAAAKIAKQYAKEGRLGDSIHANLKAYLDAGGEGFTAAGAWTRSANNRLPTGGVWTGQKGHSNFIPDNPAQLGLKPGEVIPFVEGVPNFSKWTHNLKGELVPDTTFVSRELLTGAKDDLSKMHRTIAAELGMFFKGSGKPIAAQGEAFLQRYSLSPHHSGGQTFQPLKWDLHGNPSAIPPINGVRHGDPGFGAAGLRSGGG